jgi:hypothetical protein
MNAKNSFPGTTPATMLLAAILTLAGSGTAILGNFAIAQHYADDAGAYTIERYATAGRPATVRADCANVTS